MNAYIFEMQKLNDEIKLEMPDQDDCMNTVRPIFENLKQCLDNCINTVYIKKKILNNVTRDVC